MRFTAFTMLVLGTLANSAFGADYWLKLRVTGYKKVVVVGNKKPKESQMREFQIPVTVGVPFKYKTVRGRRVFSASGTLRRSAKGAFSIAKFKWEDLVETDYEILNERGKFERATNGSTFKFSSQFVSVGKVHVVGGSESEESRTNRDGSKYRLLTKLTYKIQLVKFEQQITKTKRPTKPSIVRRR